MRKKFNLWIDFCFYSKYNVIKQNNIQKTEGANMGNIAVYSSQEIAPTGELTASLFNDFVSFIDRSANTSRAYIINLRQFAAWLKFTKCSRPQRTDIIDRKSVV